jgi:hypothetical protein
VLFEERLAHVLSRLDARDPLALRIRARLAGEDDYVRGEHAAILAVLGEARAAADPVALAEALSIAHHCLLGPDHVQLRSQLAVELTKVSVRTQRRSDLLMGLLWQTVDSYSAGDPHAGRLLSELRDHLRERYHLAAGFVVSAIEVMLAIRAGHLDDAESLAVSCAKSGAAAGDVDNEWWSAAQLVTVRWYQGRLVELLPMLRDRWVFRCWVFRPRLRHRPAPAPPGPAPPGAASQAPPDTTNLGTTCDTCRAGSPRSPAAWDIENKRYHY